MEASVRHHIAQLKNLQLDLQFLPVTPSLDTILNLARRLELELKALHPIKEDETDVLMKTMLSQ